MKVEIWHGMTMSIAPYEPDENLEAAGRVYYVYVHKDTSGRIFRQ
jgi:hypothetical protein